MEKPIERAQLQTLDLALAAQAEPGSPAVPGDAWLDGSGDGPSSVESSPLQPGISEAGRPRPIEGRVDSCFEHQNRIAKDLSKSIGEAGKTGHWQVQVTLDVNVLPPEDPRYRALLDLLTQSGSVPTSCYPATETPEEKQL